LDDGAAYDPATDTWRPMATAPFGASGTTTVWTGDEMIVLGDINGPPRAAAYDPATDVWRELDPPIGNAAPPFPRSAWTGEEAVFLVSVPPNAGGAIVALDPDTGRWRELPPVGITAPALFGLDGAIVAVGIFEGGAAAVLEPGAEAWRPLATVPTSSDGGATLVVAAGDHGLLWLDGVDASELVALDLRTGAVSTSSAVPLGRDTFPSNAIWADGIAVTWGGFGAGGAGVDRGAIARPNPTDGIEPDPPAQLPSRTTLPPDLIPVADANGDVRGTIDQNGRSAEWNGRTLPVVPVLDDDGELVGYFGCAFLEREEVERDDFVSDPRCEPVSSGDPEPGGP
jgi:hypothetical protein